MADEDIRNKALSRAIKVLECFNVETPELGITEICARLGMNKSTVHSIVVTFEAHGYLRQNPSNSRYHLDSKVFRLAGVLNRSRPQRDEISRIVRTLAAETGETVYYGIRSGNSTLYLDHMSAASFVVPKQVIGHTAPLHCTATGKAILSMLPEEEVDSIVTSGLKRMTENTLVEPARLKEDLAQSRDRGYSVDNMEHEHGVKGVGVPVMDEHGDVVAAISLSGPSLRFDDESIERFARLIDEHRPSIEITYY